MAFDDLRGFIQALEKEGELKRIPFEVDPHLEITEFADRSVKQGGPALLFEKPKGSDVPVLINAFASMKRMEIALGVDDHRRHRGAHLRLSRNAEAGRFAGQAEDAPEAGRVERHVSEDSRDGAVQRGDSKRRIFARPLSRAALLARGWRPIHYAADGVFKQP